MPGFVLESFGGIAPKIDPRRVKENVAQIAQNCLLDGNDLKPLPTMDATASSVGATDSSIYLYNGSTWLGYTNDRDFAKAPIANDALERLVITDPATYPVVYSAGTSYRLGIPAPASALTATPDTAPSDPDEVDAETVSYVYTYVDAWGAEGPPSPASTSVDRIRDTDVELTGLAVAPSGNYNFGSGAVKRIYRSNAGTDGAYYQYVGEVAIAVTSFTDDVPNDELGEILPSLTWDGPPDDDSGIYPEGPMVGITELPNGVLAGFAGKTLCFSEPYLYHAWPVDYRITFSEDIVGCVAISSGLLVTTVKRPYVVTGVHPSAMAVTRLEVFQACVSKRGMVDMGDYAIYPSPDGLVIVQGHTVELVTEGLFTRAQWQATYDPTSIHAYYYEGKYLAFYGTAGFIFDPRGGTNAFVTITDHLEAAHYDAETDTLYVNDAGTIRKWAQGSGDNAYTWKSRVMLAPRPTNYAAVRVQAQNDLATENVTVNIWADGDLKATITLDDSVTPYARLPAGFRAKEWELQVSGVNPISHIGIYETLGEAL